MVSPGQSESSVKDVLISSSTDILIFIAYVLRAERVERSDRSADNACAVSCSKPLITTFFQNAVI